MPSGLSSMMTVAAAASILASGWAAGLGAGFTIYGMPAIVNGGGSSEVMLREWRFQFLRGHKFVPTLAILNGINYFCGVPCFQARRRVEGIRGGGGLDAVLDTIHVGVHRVDE
ncbi:hypothetical protein F5Y16DRAFT_382845 [Xylariaceae sp. FL0255]|nr:hypothetical protein F5Y16DRAFT_382845 [Xylariaceae sp. FL0255]